MSWLPRPSLSCPPTGDPGAPSPGQGKNPGILTPSQGRNLGIQPQPKPLPTPTH